jgi:hypothetical protein
MARAIQTSDWNSVLNVLKSPIDLAAETTFFREAMNEVVRKSDRQMMSVLLEAGLDLNKLHGPRLGDNLFGQLVKKSGVNLSFLEFVLEKSDQVQKPLVEKYLSLGLRYLEYAYWEILGDNDDLKKMAHILLQRGGSGVYNPKKLWDYSP